MGQVVHTEGLLLVLMASDWLRKDFVNYPLRWDEVLIIQL